MYQDNKEKEKSIEDQIKDLEVFINSDRFNEFNPIQKAILKVQLEKMKGNKDKYPLVTPI